MTNLDQQNRSGRATSYDELLRDDTKPVPDVLKARSHPDLGTDGVERDRYLSREFHEWEMERLWPRVWQMACREEVLAQPGDHVVYEIGDLSLVVVRADDGAIRAFHNSCLHRGTQLRAEGGNVPALRCPFHGFTWDLKGVLRYVPTEWDFPHVDRGQYGLPEAKVATWGGFVFVNPDLDARPLDEFLGDLQEHFARFPLEDRYTSAHVGRVLACNWKTGIEAFLEAFHTFAVHPQLVTTSGDTITQYDVFEPYLSRMITPVGIPSEHVVREVTDEQILQSMLLTRGDAIDVPADSNVRAVLADRMRVDLARRTGRDFDFLSDAEALDGIEYFVFPNFLPWGGYLTPLVYRFRPWADDPHQCLMEVMLLEPLPEGDRPAPAPLRMLGEGEEFASAPELGFLGPILDQDTATVARVQRGLRASTRPTTTLARSQEVRIRHFHAVLDDFMSE
jgi:phenylpropionate dioxygenase-like ring-hydroxylating dioxygenase large terminal subunit